MLAASRTLATKATTTRTYINLYSTVSGLVRQSKRVAEADEKPSKHTGRHAEWSRSRTDSKPFFETRNHRPRSRPIIEEELRFDEDEDLVDDGTTLVTNKSRVRQPVPRQAAAHRETIKKDFPEGWAPPRKLSREAMEGLRQMHKMDPEIYTTPVLAAKFRISPEAVRRVLKSKWQPSSEQRAKLVEREKRSREEWIRERREEEKRKQVELEHANARGVYRGKDGFTLQ